MAEQEMFCCALVRSNGPKVKWLHVTCHDYWARVAELEQANRAMGEVVEAARWTLTSQRLQQHKGCGKSCIWAKLVAALARLDAATPEPPK